MADEKCRNSVFCVGFLALFLLGTICGTLLFRFLSGSAEQWLLAYSGLLTCHGRSRGAVFFSCLRPLLLAGVLGLAPCGKRAMVPLIFVRGILTSYTAAALFACGVKPGPVLVRWAVVLPLFFLFCMRSCSAFSDLKRTRP